MRLRLSVPCTSRSLKWENLSPQAPTMPGNNDNGRGPQNAVCLIFHRKSSRTSKSFSISSSNAFLTIGGSLWRWSCYYSEGILLNGALWGWYLLNSQVPEAYIAWSLPSAQLQTGKDCRFSYFAQNKMIHTANASKISAVWCIARGFSSIHRSKSANFIKQSHEAELAS
jgi:hypothetical protein